MIATDSLDASVEAELDALLDGGAVPVPRSTPARSTPARSTPALVGRVVSDSLEGTNYLTTRRWTRAEMEARSRTVLPSLGYPSPAVLDEMVGSYETITGELVRSQGKRNLIGVCYSVHGEALPALLSAEYARTGTTMNLLGIVRSTPPRDAV
jgi:hypothetical protein